MIEVKKLHRVPMTKIIVRLLREAKQQGAVLTETDLADNLLRVSTPAISRYVLEYEKVTGEVLPRAGSEMDIGKTLTIKNWLSRITGKRYLLK